MARQAILILHDVFARNLAGKLPQKTVILNGFGQLLAIRYRVIPLWRAPVAFNNPFICYKKLFETRNANSELLMVVIMGLVSTFRSPYRLISSQHYEFYLDVLILYIGPGAVGVRS